jgi:type I restriction enzyme S subunit
LAKSPALYFESEDLLDYVFSNGFYIYKVKEGWNKKFILYVLRTKRLKDVLDNHIYRGIGISAYKNEDLKKIKIPLIPKSTQNQIVAQIEPIEKKIKELKAQITPPKEIINKVFAREVGFDLEKLGELKKEKFFEVNFPKISNYHSLRFDVKNQKYLDVFNDIIKDFGSSFFLKSISKDKGKYGANEPAKDGEKGIDTRYIRITDVDSVGNLSDDDWKTAENIAEEYLLKDDDFLFARSGNTVGKTFLYDSNKHEEAIFAGYFIKFNLDFTNLDKLFFLYYTKSFIYNFWIRGIVRIKGQPNINANEYLELKIPNITLKDQQKIVDEIKIELDKQEEINKKIQTERSEIDHIIEKAIK